jgi:hypothetical protein
MIIVTSHTLGTRRRSAVGRWYGRRFRLIRGRQTIDERFDPRYPFIQMGEAHRHQFV